MFSKQRLILPLIIGLTVSGQMFGMADKVRIAFNRLCTGIGLFGPLVYPPVTDTMVPIGDPSDSKKTFIQEQLSDAGCPNAIIQQGWGGSWPSILALRPHGHNWLIGHNDLMATDTFESNKEKIRFLCHHRVQRKLNNTDQKIEAAPYVGTVATHVTFQNLAKAFGRVSMVPTIAQSLRAIPAGIIKAGLGYALTRPCAWYFTQQADNAIKDDPALLQAGIQMLRDEKIDLIKELVRETSANQGGADPMDKKLYTTITQMTFNTIIRHFYDPEARIKRLEDRIQEIKNRPIELDPEA